MTSSLLSFNKSDFNSMGVIGFGRPADHDGDPYTDGNHIDTTEYKYNADKGVLTVSVAGGEKQDYSNRYASHETTLPNMSAEDAIAYSRLHHAAFTELALGTNPEATAGKDIKGPTGNPANSNVLRALHQQADAIAKTALDQPSQTDLLETIITALGLQQSIVTYQEASKNDMDHLEGATRLKAGEKTAYVNTHTNSVNGQYSIGVWDPSADNGEGAWAKSGNSDNFKTAPEAAKALGTVLGLDQKQMATIKAFDAATSAQADFQDDSPKREAMRVLGATAAQATEQFRPATTGGNASAERRADLVMHFQARPA